MRPGVTTAALIGAPTDVGAGVPGAALGPRALRAAGLATAIAGRGVAVCDRGDLRGPRNPRLAPDAGHRHLPEVTEWNRRVHQAVLGALCSREVPVLLGGDHSLAVGSISAVARHCVATGRKLRVLWLDAHADFNTAEHSPSDNLHGMPLACLSGHGPPELVALAGRGPVIGPSAVHQLGVRSVDPGEAALVRAHGHAVYTMDYIAQHGMRRAVEAALAGVDEHTHLHVSFDVDFLDPAIAPAVGTTVQGGPGLDDARACMEMIAATGALRSLDLVELNPLLDVDNRTSRLMVELVARLLGRRDGAERRAGARAAPARTAIVDS